MECSSAVDDLRRNTGERVLERLGAARRAHQPAIIGRPLIGEARDLAIAVVEQDMRDVEQPREDMRVEPVGDAPFARRTHRETALKQPCGNTLPPRGALRPRGAVAVAARVFWG